MQCSVRWKLPKPSVKNLVFCLAPAVDLHQAFSTLLCTLSILCLTSTGQKSIPQEVGYLSSTIQSATVVNTDLLCLPAHSKTAQPAVFYWRCSLLKRQLPRKKCHAGINSKNASFLPVHDFNTFLSSCMQERLIGTSGLHSDCNSGAFGFIQQPGTSVFQRER